METIHIPPQLPSEQDLLELNRRLRAGEIQLDWSTLRTSGVDHTITPEQLAPLFAGLDLVENIDEIGATTIADDLIPIIQAAFEMAASIAAPADATNDTLPETSRDENNDMPDLWLPPQERDSDEAETAPTTKYTPLLTTPQQSHIRNELEDLIVQDLLGPVGGPEEEVLDHHVYERYLTGMLAPCDMHTTPNEQDNGETQEEGLEDTGPIDSGNAQTVSFSPSTMGMSFCVSPHITSIRVHVSWGHYQRTTSETRFREKTGKPLITWKRTPRVNSRAFALYEGQNEDWRPAEEAQYDVVVRCMTRRTPEAWNCTLFLVNGQKKPRQSIDRAWLFQPELIVEALDGGPIFQRRPVNQHASTAVLKKIDPLH